jgi:hypothetical protein
MKTLSQIESRTVIDPSAAGFTTPYNITQPGSYVLAGNINISNGTDGIAITADNVTLDLNGFALISTSSPAAGAGVDVTGTHTNITIRNGSIRGQVTYSGGSFSRKGFNTGIFFATAPTNTLLSDLTVSGCSVGGILLQAYSATSLVERCTVTNVGFLGIYGGNVSNSDCDLIGTDAISGCQRVNNSFGESLGNGAGDGVGISAITVENSFGYSPTHIGISASNVTNSYGHCNAGNQPGILTDVAINCEGVSNTGTGLNATYSAENCTGLSSGAAGISTKTVTNSYGNGTIGITATSATGCTGIGSTGTGLTADTATGCKGTSSSGTGLNANNSAENCTGISNSALGLNAPTATNCNGSGGSGITAQSATGCTGAGFGGIGLTADTATGCKGTSNSGTGLAPPKARPTATGLLPLAPTGSTPRSPIIALAPIVAPPTPPTAYTPRRLPPAAMASSATVAAPRSACMPSLPILATASTKEEPLFRSALRITLTRFNRQLD